MQWHETIVLTAAIFLGFALIHSLMVTDAAKRMARDMFGTRVTAGFYRFGFTVISVIATALAFGLIARLPDTVLFTPPGWVKWSCYALQTAGAVFGALSFKVLSLNEFMGLKQAIRHLTGRPQGDDIEGMSKERLVKTGPYGVVRHPLYLAGIVIFTFNPHVTANWLMVTVLADMYFVFGAYIEDKRLVAKFGDEYTQYKKDVPRLIPKLSPNKTG